MYSITISVRRRYLALAVVLLLVGVWTTRSDPADAGTDPPGEGIAVVYVTVGTNYADAVGAGAAAAMDGAPVIIVPATPPLPTSTATELVRLDPQTVVILGGTGAVSQAMQDAIAALLPSATVNRIGGDDRYDTNAALSESVFPVEAWISIPASAFTSVSPDIDDATIGAMTAYNASTGQLLAPIHLPDGAMILELRASVGDADPDFEIYVELWRENHNGLNPIADVNTDGTPGLTFISTTDISTINALVDNSQYAYVIEITGASNKTVHAVMVRYRLGG